MKFLILAAVIIGVVHASCPNSCSGHGTCDSKDQCECYREQNEEGYDSINKEQSWTGADCSLRRCARGISWTRKASGNECDHELNRECSDQGVCDRSTGLCTCFAGYEGSACQRTKCPNACSGHGTCRSNQDFAYSFSLAKAKQMSNLTFGANLDTYVATYNDAWDSGLQYGCQCDMGYRGPDCSLIECPSKQDPLDDKCEKKTTAHLLMTDANGVAMAAPAGGVTDAKIQNFQLQYDIAKGESGWNSAYISSTLNPQNRLYQKPEDIGRIYSCYGAMSGQDCSGRGLCDYTDGTCKCFKGYGGTACELVSEIS